MDQFAADITFLRYLITVMSASPLYGLYFLFRNFRKLGTLRSYWVSLPYAEQLIASVPYLTTIDTSIFNFVASSDPIKEFHELFKNVPVEYIPVANKDGFLILDIVANEANNPGNSVFGPKGMICPGNNITSALMKSVSDLKSQFKTEIEGKIGVQHGLIKRISNPNDVFVTFRARSMAQ